MASLKYRREIDGLRAIAVLPVILFHAGFSLFSGGFVGVDVFFVISGYLITAIIIAELDKEKFSIINFYERRARRILPALFFILAVTTFFAYQWMLPDPLENYGQSLVASTLFSNNILLTLTSGYWDLAVELKPLLHTWSLAVEEQYYIIFPVLLMLIWRIRRSLLVPSLLVLGVASFALSYWGTIHEPVATFYLFPMRAWQLLIGAFAAVYLGKVGHMHMHSTVLRHQILSLSGLIMIIIAILAYEKDTPFPGIAAILPTVGAALIILYAHKGTWVNRFLEIPFMVGVGLISYSAYLWHQPLFSLMRVYSKDEPSHWAFGILSVLALLLAAFTWKFIEAPFRDRKKFSRAAIFSFSIIGSLIFVALGLSMHMTKGFPQRIYADGDVNIADLYVSYNREAFQFKKLAFEEPEKLNILILGNSFGRDIVNVTRETFDLSRVELVYRDDVYDCLAQTMAEKFEALYERADLIVFASAHATPDCVSSDLQKASEDGKDIYYTGDKHFGYNLNWIARLDEDRRANLTNKLLEFTKAHELELIKLIPSENFIPLLGPILIDGDVPITDEKGRLLSGDRTHLTKFGAQYIGRRSVYNSNYGYKIRNWSSQ